MTTAFTLAEVLITITIIGVVAAMTIPNLLTDVNQRKYNAASGNFQRKLGEALRVMNGQNSLRGYNDTKDFVAELGKNIKILKVCDKVEECFPAKFKKNSGVVVDTSTLTDATSLGKSYGTETVGVQFADGIRAIVAYNPDYTPQTNGDIVKFTKADKTVEMKTNVISIIFDVSEDDNNKIGEDIFQKNTNLGSSGVCEHTKVGDYCIKILGTDYSLLDCSVSVHTEDTVKYCSTGTDAIDYSAGARKACGDIEMELPDIDTLTDIYNVGIKEAKGGTPKTGSFWSASSGPYSSVYILDFSSGGSAYKHNGKSYQYQVLCVGN